MGAVDAHPEPAQGRALWEREEFDRRLVALAEGMVPQVFAVTQELGDRLDGQVAAWGLAFEDRAEVVTEDGDRLRVASADACLRWFDRPGITPRLVWFEGLVAR